MVNMTVAEFLSAIGTKVTTITYDTNKTEGVSLSDDGKTANVYNVAISGEINDSNKFPVSLITADLRGLDVSGVTSMGYMFYECSGLTELDISNWDTSKVTNMYYMFYECSGLTELDISNWDTSNVTNMNCIFSHCPNLASLDLSNFDTSKVTSMYGMFEACSSLKSLNLSSFDTSKVTNMNFMFETCSSLKSLNLSSFDTSKVTSMGYMFYGCSNTQIKISNKWTLNKSSTAYNGHGLSFTIIKLFLYFKGKQIVKAYLGDKPLKAIAIGKTVNSF